MPVPTAADLAREAAAPETPQARLAELAGALPWLHPLIAGNPNVYPGLSAWIAEHSPEAVEAQDGAAALAAEAADPATPQARLAELAGGSPWTRPLIAQNPSSYDALLAWLAAFDDPAIRASLARRAGASA